MNFVRLFVCLLTAAAAACTPLIVVEYTFHGVKKGMDKEPAFQALCHASATLVPYRLVRPDGGEFSFTRPMQCSDWDYFEQTIYWEVRNTSVQCPDGSDQSAVINVGDRVVRVFVFCPSSRPKGKV